MNYTILVSKDEEAGVWIAENKTLPILLEDESIENLMERVKIAAPEIAELNGIQTPTSLTFDIHILVEGESITNG